MIRRTVRALPLAGIAAAMVGAGPIRAQAQQPITAFVDVTVVPMDTNRLVPHQTVLVRGDRITAMGPTASVDVPPSALRIDGRGKYLMPGFADMHTHVSRYSPRSIDRAFLLLLANGVTTIRDVEFFARTNERLWSNESAWDWMRVQIDGPEMLRLREQIRAGKRWGPRMYLSAAWYRDSSKSIDENLAAYKAAGYDHLKINYEVDDTLVLAPLVRGAQRLGLPIVTHGHSNDFPRTLNELGPRSIEHLAAYPFYIEQPEFRPTDTTLAEYFAAAARAGIWNCACAPRSVVHTTTALERRYAIPEARMAWGTEPTSDMVAEAQADNPPPTRAMIDSLLADSVAGQRGYNRRHFHAIQGLQRAGAGLLLGSDLPTLPTGFGVHRSLRGYTDAGLTPYQALLTTTRNPAAYFGTLDSAGTVAVGKWADLVLLTANPLENVRNAAELDGVMAAGRWLGRGEIERRLNRVYGRFLKPLPKDGSVYSRRTPELLGGSLRRGTAP